MRSVPGTGRWVVKLGRTRYGPAVGGVWRGCGCAWCSRCELSALFVLWGVWTRNWALGFVPKSSRG
jgi:hypothetical protein